MIAASARNNGQRGVTRNRRTGGVGPTILHRRIRFYGSRVLLGPRTFRTRQQESWRRPIDFLPGSKCANGTKFTNRLRWHSKATPGADHPARSHSGMAVVLLIAKNGGLKPIRNFRTRAAAKGKKIALCNGISAGSSRSPCSCSRYPLDDRGAAGLEESGIPVVDPGFDRPIAANARDRAALRGTHCLVDGAVAQEAAGEYRRAITGDAQTPCGPARAVVSLPWKRFVKSARTTSRAKGSALRRRTTDRHSAPGKNGRLPWALSFVRRTDLSARSGWRRMICASRS